MKHYQIKIKYMAVAAVFFALLISSCQKEEELGKADRLFRPIINKLSYSGTWIRLEWDKYADVKSYKLQLSTDTFKTIVSEVETDTTFYTFENLEYDTDYFIQIKSIGTELESRYLQAEAIHTPDFPTQLNPITSNDVIDTQVKVSWLSTSYDSLVVLSADTLVKTITLTDENNLSKEVIIKSLTPGSNYVVKSYQGGDYQGKKSFTTRASQVFEGDVIDLRNFTDEESYSMLNQAYFDQLAIDHPNGVTLVLSGGTTYELNGTLALSSSISIVTGLSFKGKAVIAVSGNYDLAGGATIGKLYFQGLSFTDHPNKPRNADANFGGTYVMNIGNSGSVDSLLFEDCEIRYKRGVLRIKTAAVAKVISFNNCFMDSIAGYGVVSGDHAEALISHIKITNSTVAHAMKLVTASKSLTLESLEVDHLTTCFVTSSTGNYLFDLNGQTLPSGCTITNSLFGIPWNVASTNGIRSAAGITTIQNNYRTSDCVWTFNVDALGNPTSEKAPIESTQLTESSDAIFASPGSNNYTVTDSRLVNKIGDPRWW